MRDAKTSRDDAPGTPFFDRREWLAVGLALAAAVLLPRAFLWDEGRCAARSASAQEAASPLQRPGEPPPTGAPEQTRP
jgi:hypothetical protein